MKSSKQGLVVFMLAVVVIFSGCIGSSDNQRGVGAGLQVVSFKAPAQVDSSEQFDLDLIAQNIGESTATNIQADLFQTAGIQILNQKVQTEQGLLPPNAEKGIEGEDKIFTWSLQAPTLTEDQTKSVQARITYDYKSTATSNLYIVSKSELAEKGENAFTIYSTSSNGPVTLDIVSVPPFKVNPGQTSADVKLNFVIENSASGRVVDSEVRGLKIILKGEGTEQDVTSSCPDAVGGKIKLYGRDQSRSIRCSLSLPFSETAVSYIVEAEISYTYYIDTNPFAVRVKGAEAAPPSRIPPIPPYPPASPSPPEP